MKCNVEDVRMVGEEGEAAGAVKQREEDGGHVDWVTALQSSLVAEQLARDVVKVLSVFDTRPPQPETLAFLEDLQRALRLER